MWFAFLKFWLCPSPSLPGPSISFLSLVPMLATFYFTPSSLTPGQERICGGSVLRMLRVYTMPGHSDFAKVPFPHLLLDWTKPLPVFPVSVAVLSGPLCFLICTCWLCTFWFSQVPQRPIQSLCFLHTESLVFNVGICRDSSTNATIIPKFKSCWCFWSIVTFKSFLFLFNFYFFKEECY